MIPSGKIHHRAKMLGDNLKNSKKRNKTACNDNSTTQKDIGL